MIFLIKKEKEIRLANNFTSVFCFGQKDTDTKRPVFYIMHQYNKKTEKTET